MGTYDELRCDEDEVGVLLAEPSADHELLVVDDVPGYPLGGGAGLPAGEREGDEGGQEVERGGGQETQATPLAHPNTSALHT